METAFADPLAPAEEFGSDWPESEDCPVPAPERVRILHRRQLRQLQPGTAFKLVGVNCRGVLIRTSDSRAVVRIDRPAKDVEFTDAAGQTRSMTILHHPDTSWASSCVVEVLPDALPIPESEIDMTTKTASRKTPKSPAERSAARAAADQKKAAAADEKRRCANEAAADKQKSADQKTAAKAAKKAADTEPDAAVPAAAVEPSERNAKAAAKLDAAAAVLAAAGEPLGAHEIVRRINATGFTPAINAGASIYSPLAKDIETNGKDSRFEKVGQKFAIRGQK